MTAVIVGLVAGILGGSGTALVAALFIRKKTKAETVNLMADAANSIADAAVQLVPAYRERIDDLERRLSNAEAAAVAAHQAALLSRQSEDRCMTRMAALEEQLADLRRQLLTPSPPMTGTTTISQEPTTA